MDIQAATPPAEVMGRVASYVLPRMSGRLEAAGQTACLRLEQRWVSGWWSCTSMQGEGWMEDGPGGQEDSSAVSLRKLRECGLW